MVEDLTKKSCTLTWEPPAFDGGTPIIGYYIEKSTGYSSRWIKVNREPLATVRKVFKDLIEGSEYEFRVVAENKAGVGKPSETTGRLTAKDPYGKPGKSGQPEVTNLTKDSATLIWSAPISDGGSPITNYVIEVKESGDVKWHPLTRDKVTGTTYELTGLKEGVGYEYRITAENKAGSGPTSSGSTIAKYGKKFE